MGFWTNKSVFVTGANGFVGGNLVKSLHEMGAKVVGLVHHDRPNSFLDFEALKSRILLVKGDLCDAGLLREIIANEQIEVVFHLGAQVEVGVAMRYPYMTFETNIRGTYSLLEACREHPENLKAIIMASTDKSYGTYPKDKMPYKEDYPLKAVFPYDVSKACADMIAQSYASELFKLPIVVTRFANIYGPGQLNFSALIPDATRCALGYGDFVPRGSGMQMRDFLYIGDVVDLYRVIAEKLATDPSVSGQIFNAGTNRAHLVRDVVTQIFEILGQQKRREVIDRLWKAAPPVGEIDCQFMDHEKVSRYFDWQPRTTFERGLGLTIEWFKAYLSGTQVGSGR